MANPNISLRKSKRRIAALVAIAALSAGCGGGGGGTSATVPANPPAPGTTLIGSATLSWLPPTENTDGSPLADLAGYTVYWGTSPDRLKNTVTILNPGLSAYLVEPLEPATWFFAIASLNADGLEGELSNFVVKKID